MKILLIDNFDSFTFNLYQYIGELLQIRNENFSIVVKRNNEISVQEIEKENFDRIIISPGSGEPSDQKYFGVCTEVLQTVSKSIPTMGVCLGMQGMAYVYGGKIERLQNPMHGKTSLVTHDDGGVFAGLPQNIEVMRYHSLIVDERSLLDSFVISATAEDGEIMGIRHKEYPMQGVQFHPESFATEGGKIMLQNFLTK